MIVDYPVTLVRFENLEGNVVQAELQKDNILQAVALAFPGLPLLVEKTQNETKSTIPSNEGVTIRCEQCVAPFFGRRHDELFAADSRTKFTQLIPESLVAKITSTNTAAQSFANNMSSSGGKQISQYRKHQISFDVQFNKDQAVRHTWQVSVTFSALRFRIAAAKSLAQGIQLESSLIEVTSCFESPECPEDKSFESAAKAKEYFALNLQGMHTSRYLAKNATLTKNDAKALQLVQRGQEVKVTYAVPGSGLTVLTRGTALQSGCLKEEIEVEMVPVSMGTSYGSQTSYPSRKTRIRGQITARGEIQYAE